MSTRAPSNTSSAASACCAPQEDIGNIVVAAHDGTPVLVKDIADVTISAVPRQGVVGQDDDDDVVTGIVLMRKGENPSDVLASVKQRVALLNQSILPKGVQIVPFYDRTWLIGKTLKTVFTNLVEGAMLVTLVLLLFLGNLRAAAIVALIIPLSLLATFIGLRIRGIPANLLSLGAMDFGIIVDGAVIVLENIFRKLSDHKETHDRRSLKTAILEAATEVGRPTVFSMLIIIAAHIPIFTLQRHEGRIFAPMAYSVTSALVASLIFSLTLVPLLCYFLLRKKHFGEGQLHHPRQQALVSPGGWALRLKRPVLVAVVAVLLAGSLALVPSLGTEFLPELNEGALWVNINLPTSVSVPETHETMRAHPRGAAHKFPEVEHRGVQGRPARGRNRSKADQHGRNVRRIKAGRRVEAQDQQGADSPTNGKGARSHTRH